MNMDLSNRKVWQIAAGDTNRNYARWLIRWDVVCMGPGERGPWPDCEPSLRRDGWPSRKLSTIQRFACDIEPGHIVILRIGTTDAYAVGIVDGEYIWLDDFGDIDGWDLQHVRRVRWLWSAVDSPQRFRTYDLKFGDTVQEVGPGPVLEWLQGLNITEEAKNRELVRLPDSCIPSHTADIVEVDEIAQHLFDLGRAADEADRAMKEISEVLRLAKWYSRTQTSPSESETVSYLVVPLLKALGWTPQRMAIEWNNIDVALFNKLPREDGNLAAVVEAKKKSSSCLSARGQAEAYALTDGRQTCERLVVTDGIRYGIYLRDKHEGFSDGPDAYLNLTRLVPRYPVLGCHGAKEALVKMSADWRELAHEPAGEREDDMPA